MEKKKKMFDSHLDARNGFMPNDLSHCVRRALFLFVIGAICLSAVSEASADRPPDNASASGIVLPLREVEENLYLLADNLTRAGVFIALSGIFAGLTIGIMCVDTLTLDVIADSGPEPDRTYASRILPLRREGHRTLCTLIFANMLMNVLAVQEFNNILDTVQYFEMLGLIHSTVDFSNPFLKFVVSTVIILVFTEIIPMSICKSKYSLRIAAAGSGLVRLASVLAYLVAVPLGAILDYFVPHDAGQIYDRRELRKLMVLHCENHGDRSGLVTSELKLLIAAMDFHEKKVKDIMTPIGSTLTVNIDQEITADFVNQVWSSGFSRFPVMSGQNTYTDVLLVKDLLRAKALGVKTIGELVFAMSRGFTTVGVNASLPSVLRFFQQSHTHMLLVCGDADHETEGKSMDDTPTTEVRFGGSIHFQNTFFHRELMSHVSNIVGIVTLEDVVEELIKEEIYDEYDSHTSTKGNTPVFTKTPAVPSWTMDMADVPLPISEPDQQPRANFYSFCIHPDVENPLTNAQVWVVAYFLTRAVPSFFFWHPGYVKMLLDECGDLQLVPSRPNLGKKSMESKSEDFWGSNIQSGEKPTDPNAFSSLSDDERPVEALRLTHEEFLAQASDERFVLYRAGQETSNFTLVLGGRVEILIGSEGFPSSRRSFEQLGEGALKLPSYASDFSAVVLYPVRIYKISKHLYEKYLFYNTVLNKYYEYNFFGNGKKLESLSGRSTGQMKGVQTPVLPQSHPVDCNVFEENEGLLSHEDELYGTFSLLKHSQ